LASNIAKDSSAEVIRQPVLGFALLQKLEKSKYPVQTFDVFLDCGAFWRLNLPKTFAKRLAAMNEVNDGSAAMCRSASTRNASYFQLGCVSEGPG
jgi:hypothetical protein